MTPFVHLAIPHYLDDDMARRFEVIEALRLNLMNPLIETVDILVEDERAKYEEALKTSAALYQLIGLLAFKKARVTWLGRRSMYKDLFDALGAYGDGAVCVGAYCDIYFDETLEALRQARIGGMFLATAKWDAGRTAVMRSAEHYADDPERRGSRPYNPVWSQDCWIFSNPLKPFPCDWKCGGSPGDENKLAYEAHKAGLIVRNPSLTVKAWHLHESGVRRWKRTDRVWSPTSEQRADYPNMAASRIEDILKEHGR